MRHEAIEEIPAKAADSAIIVSLAAKVEPAKRQRRKLGDRTRRKQSDGDTLAASIQASYARDPG